MSKPSISPKTTPVPTSLTINDLVVGEGALAGPGQRTGFAGRREACHCTAYPLTCLETTMT